MAEEFEHFSAFSNGSERSRIVVISDSTIVQGQCPTYRDVEEDDSDDVALDEFKDEIEPWVIDALKAIIFTQQDQNARLEALRRHCSEPSPNALPQTNMSYPSKILKQVSRW